MAETGTAHGAGAPGPGQAEAAEFAAAAPAGRLAVVVFSKDRPYQLACCLSSLLRHVTGVSLEVSVLFRASAQAFQDSYTVVQHLFASGVSESHTIYWEEETASAPLGALLDRALERAGASGAGGLLFTVDDALWFDSFDAAEALELLQTERAVYAVHAKLCPRVEYAHPNDKFMRVPQLRAHVPRGPQTAGAGSAPLEPSLLTYDRSQGEYDWNYPWELSASIYRLTDVREMLAAIREHFGEEGVGHPNRLEGFGVRLFKQEKVEAAKRTSRCACASRSIVVVVTINRVQALFDNPVYGQDGGSAGSQEASPEALDRALRAELRRADAGVLAQRLGLPGPWLAVYCSGAGMETAGSVGELVALASSPPGCMLPLAAYRAAYLDSVHVPLLQEAVALASPAAPFAAVPVVSWLMPIFNTPAEWLEEALHSIRAQAGMGPGSWELVVVDDCSDQEDTLAALARWEALPEVVIVRLGRRSGVAEALNAGWRRCRGAFVARLDGDDMAQVDRLQRQLAYLDAHPSISILGGGFRTFQSSDELRSPAKLAGSRQYRMPCHPLLARWHMLFSCSLAHPTVVLRRADFAADGPYPLCEEAEDHCCWLALPLHLHLANIADVVSFLRRHPSSRSATAAAAIRRSSYGAVRRFLAAHSGDGAAAEQLTDEDVSVLWGSASASSAEQARRVSRALDAAEALFVELASPDGPRAPQGHEARAEEFSRSFLGPRSAALQEYVRASCGKLRGLLTVQSLAAGDLSSGTEMMKLWLKGGDAGLKSLGALVGAGFPGQAPQ